MLGDFAVSSSNSGYKTIRLLEDERGGMMFAPSTNSITFFSGSLAEESLRLRIGEIIQSNPWLEARLVKSDVFDEVVAQYPTELTNVRNTCFQSKYKSDLSKSMPYHQLVAEVSEALVPIGVTCTGKDIPLWRVTLYTINDCEYAIVVSLSHVLGDGHTFYALYSMLSKDQPITALTCERFSSFGECLVECVGQPLQDWIYSSWFSAGINNTLQRESPSVCGYTVNKHEIQRLKDQVRKGFVSTNDIIVSWFCRLCQSAYGLMVVNFRQRIEGLTDAHTGNYHKILVYAPEQYSSPEGVRQTLPSFNKGGRLPSQEETLEFNLAMITNWSAFYRDITVGEAEGSSGSECRRDISGRNSSVTDEASGLGNVRCVTVDSNNADDINSSNNSRVGNSGSGSQLVAHFPLLNPSQVNFRDCCVVFQLDTDTLAVMLFTRSAVDIPQMVSVGHPSVSLLEKRII